MIDRLALADRLDKLLNAYLLCDEPGLRKSIAESDLQQELWDNKAGIIAVLRGGPGWCPTCLSFHRERCAPELRAPGEPACPDAWHDAPAPRSPQGTEQP